MNVFKCIYYSVMPSSLETCLRSSGSLTICIPDFLSVTCIVYGHMKLTKKSRLCKNMWLWKSEFTFAKHEERCDLVTYITSKTILWIKCMLKKTFWCLYRGSTWYDQGQFVFRSLQNRSHLLSLKIGKVSALVFFLCSFPSARMNTAPAYYCCKGKLFSNRL